MDQQELLNRILFLIPDAKFSVWECEAKDFQGEGDPIIIDKFLIAWNSTNSSKCPSWDDIQNVDINSVNAMLEKNRKLIRNMQKMNDLTMVACYQMQKQSNPDLNFSDYLDSLEAQSKSMLAK